ncbi:MAG: SEL1-like repeat protein [Methylococcaceae bacterium]
MILLYKPIKLFVLVVSAALLLTACSEKAADSSNPNKISASTVTEDKIAQLQREAQEGDPDAQYNLAYLYENGLGVAKDETRALELYQQAADQGNSAAQANLNEINETK